MRKWAYLKKPYYTNKRDIVYKIMIHEQKKYTLVYLYCARDAVRCSYDNYYPDLESALEDWENEINAEGWQDFIQRRHFTAVVWKFLRIIPKKNLTLLY